MNQFLLLLAIVPLACFYLASLRKPDLKWRLTGITFGLVIAPVSLCLLQYVYVPVIGKLFGLIGLVLNLIHGSVGYFIAVGMGMAQPGELLAGSELGVINLINGAIWATYYGILGYHFDLKQIGAEQAEMAEEYKKEAVM
jgi:hypothetical protein